MDINQAMSDNCTGIIKAVLAVQSSVTMPERTKRNTHTNSDYAPLEEVLAAIKEPLATNGLVITHHKAYTSAILEDGVVVRPDREVLITQITHTSGEWLRTFSTMRINPDKSGRLTAQGAGSAETYARRYNIKSLLNLAEEDDDGSEASQFHDQPKSASVTSLRSTAKRPEPARQAAPASAPAPSQAPAASAQSSTVATTDDAQARKKAYFDAASEKMQGFLKNIQRLSSDSGKEPMVRAYIAKELSGDESAYATKIANKLFAKQQAAS